MSPVPNFTKLLVFAKVPRLGQVKTRLEPFLGAECCLLLHQCLIAHAMELARGWTAGPVELWLADQPNKDDLPLNTPESVAIRYQEAGNLGERMQFALQSAVSNGYSAVLIGTDSPQQNLSHLEEATSLLNSGADVIVQPALDGGFVLIACANKVPNMSGDIDWGTVNVLDQLQKVLKNQRLSCYNLETISDLDTREDIILLQEVKSVFLSDFYKKAKLHTIENIPLN
jgi:rSAM/selenodomain-associated transferase 1